VLQVREVRVPQARWHRVVLLKIHRHRVNPNPSQPGGVRTPIVTVKGVGSTPEGMGLAMVAP
jgi:hypothetical protein